MEAHLVVKISQKFLIFCASSSRQYTITLQGSLLNLSDSYFVHYIFPNKTTKEARAEAVTEHELLVKGSPEYDHPCTIHAEVRANGSEECLAKFSLDLVSPVEYLFRSLYLDDKEMSSKISHKMNSALLAMSLSYYYVVEDYVEKEEKADEILSTLLGNIKHGGPNAQRIGNSSNITQFAQRHQLHNTLQCLSVEDLPAQSPKSKHNVPPMSPDDKESSEAKLSIKPRIVPRTFQSTHQQSVYTPLAGEFKADTDQSGYTSLIRDKSHKETEEPNEVQKKKLERDKSYEEVKEAMYNLDYEEIKDEQPYEEAKDVQPYEKPINTLRKEKSYEEPDDATDQPLSSPIYIVPDPEEQKKMEYLYRHVDTQNTVIHGEHNTTNKGQGKHRRSKSMEFLDYDEIKPYRPPIPPPPIFKKEALHNEISLMTKYNTTSRLEKRSVIQSLSAVRPFRSGRTSPQPNEKPVVKKDSTPSPKPRHVTKIYV